MAWSEAKSNLARVCGGSEKMWTILWATISVPVASEMLRNMSRQRFISKLAHANLISSLGSSLVSSNTSLGTPPKLPNRDFHESPTVSRNCKIACSSISPRGQMNLASGVHTSQHSLELWKLKNFPFTEMAKLLPWPYWVGAHLRRKTCWMGEPLR